jgi:hypothetical protein
VTGYSADGPELVSAVLVYRFDNPLIQEVLILPEKRVTAQQE